MNFITAMKGIGALNVVPKGIMKVIQVIYFVLIVNPILSLVSNGTGTGAGPATVHALTSSRSANHLSNPTLLLSRSKRSTTALLLESIPTSEPDGLVLTVPRSETITKSIQRKQSSSTKIKFKTAAPERLPIKKKIKLDELKQFREYDTLRGELDTTKLKKFFLSRPHLILGRFMEVTTTLQLAKNEWDEAGKKLVLKDGKIDVPVVDDPEINAKTGTGVNDQLNVQFNIERGIQLCNRVSSLGPVAVKIAQTLSQRPDIVGAEACHALKRLQTENTPFPDHLAFAILKESLNWDGPIAPGIGCNDTRDSGQGKKTLFASMTTEPVAVASLGQVYKATTHEGKDVAVKIQRPDGMQLLAVDIMCFKLVYDAIDLYRKIQPGEYSKGLIGMVVDRVAADMAEELDYKKEALNGKKFEESLKFLGFVKTPKVIPEYSSERVLVTEWVKGAHLGGLSKEDGLLMTRMAVEACTASMVLTGYVHADPHEGNLMLDEDGNLVVLDFGLMSDVSENVMEAFARGIQGCLSEDWIAVTKAFKATGFINDPIEWKPDKDSKWRPFGVDPVTGEDLGLEMLASELGRFMGEVEGGTSRFGALATILNKKLSPNWHMITPPYVLLLIRTFLTLEGIAARVDPDFNIYEMAMPWAVRRSLSPSTEEGIATLRSTLLTEDNRIQWNRLLELVGVTTENETTKKNDKEMEASSSTTTVVTKEDEAENIEKAKKAQSNKAAKASAMNDAVGSLLGSPEGFVLRRAIRDLDSIDLVQNLLSKEGKILIKKAVLAIFEDSGKNKSNIHKNFIGSKNDGISERDARPVSEACLQLRERQLRWRRKVTTMLFKQHFRRQVFGGPRTLAKASYLSMRVGLGALRSILMKKIRLTKRRLMHSI